MIWVIEFEFGLGKIVFVKQGAAKRRAPRRICNGVQNSRCPGNIRKMYVGCPHPHRPEPRGWDTWNRAIQSCFG